MAITREEVIHTAKLARLELTEDEIARLGMELTRITDYMAQLREAVAGEKPRAPKPERVTNRAGLRNDEVHSDSVGETVLEHTPDSEGRFFRVPKVID